MSQRPLILVVALAVLAALCVVVELPLPIFFTILGCFGAGLIVWDIKLFQRCHKPDPLLGP